MPICPWPPCRSLPLLEQLPGKGVEQGRSTYRFKDRHLREPVLNVLFSECAQDNLNLFAAQSVPVDLQWGQLRRSQPRG